ncbi:VOC family protein [uncultured Draconibacterium sp.]|uniref:VOC family protein n=1 Tax=uncultured Draconibacterium sp. TaxID=1573823 RepID=UPI0032167BD0
MTKVNVYLTFNGNCEEAFNFYKSVFGNDFAYVGRFKDMPPMEGIPPISGEAGERIMHIGLPVSKETVLMGSDTGGEWGPPLTVGNNFSITISADSREEALRFHEQLSENGQITMPMSDTFWGSYFGTLTDKFGINWMVSFDENIQ